MNPRLSPVTRTGLVKRFRKLGWEGPKPSRGHDYMVKGRRKVHTPNPHKHKDIGAALLGVILKQAGISREEWNATSN